MKGILKEIVEHKRQEVEERKRIHPLELLQNAAQDLPPSRDFKHALRREKGIKLLAEIKAASPSTGILRNTFDPGEIASLYQRCGASALSVLTDYTYFSGTDRHLQEARAAVQLPVLRKDFTLDEYQLYESRVLGADAVLLMAQILDQDTYAQLLQKAHEIGLHVLAEGHTAEQIQFLVHVGAEVIGINNRDFDTMTTDLQTTLNHRPLVPDDRVLVSQSGIFHRQEVLQLQAAGVDAIQVGTSLMKHGNMEEQLHQLMHD